MTVNVSTDRTWSLTEVAEAEGVSASRMATHVTRWRHRGWLPGGGRGSGNWERLTVHDRAVVSFLVATRVDRPGNNPLLGAELTTAVVNQIRRVNPGCPHVIVVVGPVEVAADLCWPEVIS